MNELVAGAMVAFALVGGGTAFARGRGEWVHCADEGGVCRVPYPTVVRYGARGGFTEQRTDIDVRCSNGVFGDPLHGVRKPCFYLARRDDGGGWGTPSPRDAGAHGEWRTCAREHEFCAFRRPARVRYGTDGRWVSVNVADGIQCDNRTFGQDPAYGIVKVCQIRR